MRSRLAQAWRFRGLLLLSPNLSYCWGGRPGVEVRAYDKMIRATDTKHARWWIVPSNDKKRAHQLHFAHSELIPL